MDDGIFEFSKAQRKYWEEKRDDNNRGSAKQSEPSSEWRGVFGGLFGRRRVFRLPDKTEGHPIYSRRCGDVDRYDLLRLYLFDTLGGCYYGLER